MLWTNTTLSHLHYIFVTYTSCGLYGCLLCINLGLESQYFLNMLSEKTSDHHHCQNESIQIHSHLSLTFETKTYLMVRLLGSPVKISQSVARAPD